MRALSIRQPYAELILRGIKTAELRSMSTTIVGERFFIYACKAKAKGPIWSDDLRVGTPPAWMIELAEQVKLIEGAGAYGISIANLRALLTALIFAAPSRVIRRMSRDFGTVK